MNIHELVKVLGETKRGNPDYPKYEATPHLLASEKRFVWTIVYWPRGKSEPPRDTVADNAEEMIERLIEICKLKAEIPKKTSSVRFIFAN